MVGGVEEAGEVLGGAGAQGGTARRWLTGWG